MIYWSILRGILECTGVYWSVLEYTGVYWSVLEYTGVYWSVLECTRVYWSVLRWYTEPSITTRCVQGNLLQSGLSFLCTILIMSLLASFTCV